MPRTPDRRPGSLDEEEILLEERLSDPTTLGAMRYVSGDFRFNDSVGAFNPRDAFNVDDHEALRQLIHYIDGGPTIVALSGAYKEIIGQPFPTSITWYEDNTKAKKIFEKLIERSTPPATVTKPTPVVYRIYDTDGVTVLREISDSLTYSGVFEINRTRTITTP